MPSKLETAYQAIVETQKKVADTLQEQSQTVTGIFITTKLNEIVNKLSFQLGVASGGTAPSVQTFEPVTNFMGEEIKRTPAVSESDLSFAETEEYRYTKDVDALQSTFRDRKPETLIQDFTDKPFVLRGVAKRAGLEDYEAGLINIDFIERVKAGLDAIDQRAKEEDAINQELTAIGEEVTGNVPTIPVNAYDGNPAAPTGFNDNVNDVTVNSATVTKDEQGKATANFDITVPDAVVNKELDPAPTEDAPARKTASKKK